MGESGGVLVFLTIVGGFFGFMFILSFLTVRVRAPRGVRDYGWPPETDTPAPFLDLLLRLVWGVVIVAALMAGLLAAIALVVASLPFVLGYELNLRAVLRDLLTVELVYSIVIAASLVVGLALFVLLLIADLISERKRRFLDEP